MAIRRKLPGEGTTLFGSNAESEPHMSELEFSQLISRVREDNPDLPDAFIEAILVSLGEVEAAKLLEYMFE